MACEHYPFGLSEKHRHFVDTHDAMQYNNCLLCIAGQKGPMTQEEVGKYLNLTKMRISQIERQAMQRMKNKMEKICEDNPLHS